jgi:hypothetical protein
LDNIVSYYRSLESKNGDKDAAINTLKEVLEDRGVEFVHMVSPTVEGRDATDAEVHAFLSGRCAQLACRQKKNEEKDEKMKAKVDALNAAAAAAAGLKSTSSSSSTSGKRKAPPTMSSKSSTIMKAFMKTTATKSSASGMATAAAASATESSAATKKKVMKAAAKSSAATKKNGHVEVTKLKSVDDDLGFLDKDEDEEVTEEEVTPKKKPVMKLGLVCDLTGESSDESSGESSDESPSHEKKKRRGFGEDASDASWTGEEE